MKLNSMSMAWCYIKFLLIVTGLEGKGIRVRKRRDTYVIKKHEDSYEGKKTRRKRLSRTS